MNQLNEFRPDAVPLSVVLAKAHALPLTPVDVPVNLCPDDDPAGERPMKRTWVTDMNAVAAYVLDSDWMAERDARVAADALEEAAEWAEQKPIHELDQYAYAHPDDVVPHWLRAQAAARREGTR